MQNPSDVPSGSPRGDYRPALDGVRAFAVLAVIAYHVGGRARGGFLGVDVFFVLSGYLITTLLLRERTGEGRIKLSYFWARRARRLFPALLCLLAVTALVTAATTPAAELATRRDDMLSTLFYFANWHFIASDASYFTTALGISPLRHMWSLAIEEQFYVVWPLVVLAVLWLVRGRRGPLLAVAVAGALVAAVWMAAQYEVTNPSRAYFGTETHAFPLLVGCALAIILLGRPGLLSGKGARQLAGWLWAPLAIGVLVAVVSLGDQDPFYYRGGLLLFALCVALVLWSIEARPASPLGRALSLPPVRWVGIISYGLYLWHWPLLVWLGEPDGGGSRLTQLGVVAATFAAATVSFYVVERPIRRGQVPWLRLSRGRLAFASAVAFLLVSAATIRATHINSDSVVSQVADTSDIPCPDNSARVTVPGIFSYSWCMFVQPESARDPVVATVGDSTSRALTPGFQDFAESEGWVSFRQVRTAARCSRSRSSRIRAKPSSSLRRAIALARCPTCWPASGGTSTPTSGWSRISSFATRSSCPTRRSCAAATPAATGSSWNASAPRSSA